MRYVQLIALLPIYDSAYLHWVVLARPLKSLSITQGVKYDDPESAKAIPTFIEFHELKVEEILDLHDSFSACYVYLEFFF